MSIYRDGKRVASGLDVDVVRTVGMDPGECEVRPDNQDDARVLTQRELLERRDLFSHLGIVADGGELAIHWLAHLTLVLMETLPEIRGRLGVLADLADLVKAERETNRMPYEVKGPVRDTVLDLLRVGEEVTKVIEKYRR